MKEYKIIAPYGQEINESALKEGRIEFVNIKKELPKTWKELKKVKGYWTDDQCELHHLSECACFDDAKDIWPSKEEAEASIALAQLCQLRNVYNDGWKPDWKDATLKYGIYFYGDKKAGLVWRMVSGGILSFKTEELRNLFSKNFDKLIHIAKPLLQY